MRNLIVGVVLALIVGGVATWRVEAGDDAPAQPPALVRRDEAGWSRVFDAVMRVTLRDVQAQEWEKRAAFARTEAWANYCLGQRAASARMRDQEQARLESLWPVGENDAGTSGVRAGLHVEVSRGWESKTPWEEALVAAVTPVAADYARKQVEVTSLRFVLGASSETPGVLGSKAAYLAGR